MRVVSVVGARSELVKCAPVSRVLARAHQEVLIHTGSRLGYGTTPEFYEDLGLRFPDHDLGIDRGSTAGQVGAMLRGLSGLIRDAAPDWVLVYGSSSATLAGALAAAQQGIRVGHVEAGVRSYRRDTPDELYPIVVDHVATLHFCPTEHAVTALVEEGLSGVHHVGDVLFDNVLAHLPRAETEIDDAALLSAVGLDTQQPFAFATLHHHENTDDSQRLSALIAALSSLPIPVVLPLHPRSQESLGQHPEVVARIGENVHIVDPLRPLVTMRAVSRATVILTDSGGLQREAYFLGVPCITLRDGTEWVDTLNLSANTVVGADPAGIRAAIEGILGQPRVGQRLGRGGPYGSGDAADKIVGILARS